METAQWHLALNHLPTVGLLIGILQLAWASFRPNPSLQRASYVILVGAAIFTLITYLTGEPAEHVIEELMSDSHDWIHEHEEWAEWTLWAGLLTGALAAGALLKPLNSALRSATLLVSTVSLGLLLYTAHLGAEIRHTEIRSMLPNAEAPEIEAEGEYDDD
jgi:hypothetical protein